MQSTGLSLNIDDALFDRLADAIAARVVDRLSAKQASSATADCSPALLRERATAQRLGVSVQLLRKWRASGDGPRHIKLGRSVRYAVEDVDGYAASRKSSDHLVATIL